eukprot:15346753-Ditylum_brightwellii.AAC.1
MHCRSDMLTLENEIGDTIKDVSVAKMDEALHGEIKLIIEKEHNKLGGKGKMKSLSHMSSGTCCPTIM